MVNPSRERGGTEWSIQVERGRDRVVNPSRETEGQSGQSNSREGGTEWSIQVERGRDRVVNPSREGLIAKGRERAGSVGGRVGSVGVEWEVLG